MIDRNITATRKRPGFVYLIREHTGLFKVGYAIDVEKRLMAMQSGNAYPLEIVAKVPVANMVLAEKDLHDRLAYWRVSREWFRFTDVKVWHDAVLMAQISTR